MLLESLRVDVGEFERRMGWSLKPEGACKGELCVPMPEGSVTESGVDVTVLADRLGMPLVRDEAHGIYALGPESGGHALTTAQAPELILPDLDGNPFSLASLRGMKVLLVAWASW